MRVKRSNGTDARSGAIAHGILPTRDRLARRESEDVGGGRNHAI